MLFSLKLIHFLRYLVTTEGLRIGLGAQELKERTHYFCRKRDFSPRKVWELGISNTNQAAKLQNHGVSS